MGRVKLQLDPNRWHFFRMRGFKLISTVTIASLGSVGLLSCSVVLSGYRDREMPPSPTREEVAEEVVFYEAWIESHPKDAEAYLQLGKLLHQQGENTKAIAILEQSIRLNPRNARAYIQLGNIWRERKEIVKAIAYYKQATRLNPNSAEAYFQLGVALKQQGNLHQAASAFNESLRIDSNNPDAYRQLTNCLYKIRQRNLRM